MKAKPSEIKKMAALLDEEADSSEDMAKKVWELVEELTAKRDQYMAVAVYPSLQMAIAVGPYNTINNLKKDYANHVGQVDDGYGIIATVRDPAALQCRLSRHAKAPVSYPRGFCAILIMLATANKAMVQHKGTHKESPTRGKVGLFIYLFGLSVV